jgi:phospholipase C
MRSSLRTLVVLAVMASSGAVVAVGSAARPASGASGISQVKHVVVLMQENRSADHYLGQLSKSGQPDYEAEPATGNPDPLHPGTTIPPFHKSTLCETKDLSHSWNATHQEWDNGAMDGFTAANDINSENSDPADPNGSRTMGYYDAGELPFYYSLFNTFATGDRYFASVLSQTFPNRYYLLAGTSFGHIDNAFPPAGGWKQKTIFDLLGDAGVTWKIYYSQFAFGGFFSYVKQHEQGHVAPMSQYFEDTKNGNLPEVSFVDPSFLGEAENDEHPPTNVQDGQKFTYDVVSALEGSADWGSSALFLTYDEHGGFYDHVPPPLAPKPDNIPPMLGATDTPGAFDRYGIRVPAAVISPFAKSHFVSHVVHDHTSILRFIETRYGLSSLTARDAAADPMLEFFDFANPPFVTPPSFAQPSVTPCAVTATTTTTTTTTPSGPTTSVSPTTSVAAHQTSTTTTTVGQGATTTAVATTTTAAAHVLAAQLSQPAAGSALSLTGIDVQRLVATAIGCILLGIVLLAGRRRNRHASTH